MNIVKVKDWEEGRIQLPDDVFEPIKTFHPLLGPKVTGFKGRATGIILEPKFANVLEGGNVKKEKD